MELSEKTIKAAIPGDVLRDASISGFHVRCFEQRKSFYLYFRTKAGKERKPKIGDYGSITLAQARAVARDMLAEVAGGKDPSAIRQAERDEKTLTDLWDAYWKRHGSKKKSAKDDEGLWRRYLVADFGKLKLSEIDYEKIADKMDALSTTPIGANRMLSLLSKMFNFGILPLKYATTNPCKGVRKYPENKRKRYMTNDEAAALSAILARDAEKNPASIAFLYLLILTGARKGEIANARWSYLQGNVLAMPDGKNGAKPVYLPPAAMEVIAKLPRTTGTITGIKSPQKVWLRIRKEANCTDLHLHDLRHSFASVALSAGLSLAQIGELLGHANTQTTKRYAHLIDDAAHVAVTAVADQIALRMRGPITVI